MAEKLKQLFLEYGMLAIIIHFVIFFLSWGLFYLALKTGLDLDDLEWLPEFIKTGGNVAIAYGITQAIKPFRIVFTLILTPVVGRFTKKKNLNSPTIDDVPKGDDSDASKKS